MHSVLLYDCHPTGLVSMLYAQQAATGPYTENAQLDLIQ